MKKFFFCVMLSTASYVSKAQVAYSFSVSTAPYTNLTGGNSLIGNPLYPFFETNDTTISIGFPFNFFGTLYDSILIYPSLTGLDFIKEGDINYPYIYPLDADVDQNNSLIANVSYKVEGTVPNRIFKVQWYQVAFEDDIDNDDTLEDDFTSRVNLQIWLHETLNKITFHYGNSSGFDTSFFVNAYPLCGLNFNDSIGYFIGGNPSNPTVNDTSLLYGIPPANTMYTFTPYPLGINKVSNNQSLQVFPNPSNGNFNLLYNEQDTPLMINIYNITGQLVHSQKISGTRVSIPHVEPGYYFLEVKGDDKKWMKKIVITE